MRSTHPQYRRLPPHRVITRNPKHEWLEKNYPGYLNLIFMQGIHAGVFMMNRRFPFGFKVGYSINEATKFGSEIDWYWDTRDLERVRKLFLNRSKRDLAFFDCFYRWWEPRNRTALAECDRADHINVSKISDTALYRLYERLYWTNIAQGAAGYLADSFLAVGDDDWLSKFIVSRIGDRNASREILATLTAPSISTYSQEEEQALRTIARSIGGTPSLASLKKRVVRDSRLSKKLNEHAARYYWLENGYFSKVLTPSYFIGKLHDLITKKNLDPVTTMIADNRRTKAALLRRLDDRWLTNVIAMSERMTHLQDYRKLAFIRFNHFAHVIFVEMAHRTGLKEEDFHNLIEPEIADVFLRRRIDRRMLAQRRMKSFCYGTPRGYVVYQGAQLKRYVDETQFRRQYAGISAVKGMPACVGLVRGTARIVRNAHKAGSFKRGDILITNQTTPEFVPIMKRASAVVTEQGGITAHAAIISRELGIPCVIGTKIATKVFKDGDRIEVDADHGIVRKLGRA